MTPPSPSPWRPVAADPPPEGVAVETCVRDERGEGSYLPLCRAGNAWFDVTGCRFTPYRTPTHWRPLT